VVIGRGPIRADNYEPVRHSVKLNPWAAAIASIILELTVDATIESFSEWFCGRMKHLLLQAWAMTYLVVYPTLDTALVFFQRKLHPAGLR